MSRRGVSKQQEPLSVVSKKGGQDNKLSLDRRTLTGDVKVSSVSTNEVSGDVDPNSGGASIKGSFTAKVLKK